MAMALPWCRGGLATGPLLALCLVLASLVGRPAALDTRRRIVPQGFVRRPVLLDCDPGIDDVFALLWICSRLDALELVVVTAAPGNVEGSQALRNALGAMRLFDCGHNVTLGVGVTEAHRQSDGFMGGDGLQGHSALLPEVSLGDDPILDAGRVIVDAVDRFGPDLAIVAIGPLGNLAAAERLRPGLLSTVRDLLIMGGAVVGGNVKPYAEFNFWYDAPSAKAVLAAATHAVLFPLDVTSELCFGGEYTDRLLWEAPGAASHFLSAIRSSAERQSHEWGVRCLFMHDAHPVGFLLEPELFSVVRRSMDVALGDEEGKSFLVPGGRPNVWQAVKQDEKLFEVLVEAAVAHLAAADMATEL
eukprot:CAMPEP_0203919092 /NCGR_PEP_ID=MMETSP0359-20131031/59562_1 /ASSEMBLY_ACC=CAM_ASM_000338 /TAXON_ID=268821 /ORGANISM="Scrippsiella Hangoei, Strain SHTV-5" /LENGTH=358 /DNA_ID=CAMNT_0050846307 /DNA_START=17 /DNA_END=1093 /DNA_ORIENTATION=+